MNTVMTLSLSELKRLYREESKAFVQAMNEETPQQLEERENRIHEITHRITAHMNHPIYAPFL